MGKHLWAIIEGHRDSQPYPPSVNQVSKRMGVTRQSLSNWQNIDTLPARESLEAIARVTGNSYLAVLRAALRDVGYLKDHESL